MVIQKVYHHEVGFRSLITTYGGSVCPLRMSYLSGFNKAPERKESCLYSEVMKKKLPINFAKI